MTEQGVASQTGEILTTQTVDVSQYGHAARLAAQAAASEAENPVRMGISAVFADLEKTKIVRKILYLLGHARKKPLEAEEFAAYYEGLKAESMETLESRLLLVQESLLLDWSPDVFSKLVMTLAQVTEVVLVDGLKIDQLRGVKDNIFGDESVREALRNVALTNQELGVITPMHTLMLGVGQGVMKTVKQNEIRGRAGGKQSANEGEPGGSEEPDSDKDKAFDASNWMS